MSTALNVTPEARREWPYAVGVTMPGDESPTFVHFAHKPTANVHAYVMDTDRNIVTRWVALEDGSGWREVTYFYL